MTARTFGPYPGTVVSVHDGDTCTIALDLGFGLTFTGATCRVFGINAPELVTQAGKDALAYAQTLLHPGDRVTVLSRGWDKFGGRYDGSITLADGRDFATRMLMADHAVVYP
jgi:endonuclease YncB( thermonuclease family)